MALYRRLSGVTSRSGRLAILTLLGGRGGVSALFAVQMLVAANGGDTHRSEDYRRWLGEAGFSLVDIVEPGDRPHSLLLAAPEPPA